MRWRLSRLPPVAGSGKERRPRQPRSAAAARKPSRQSWSSDG